MIIDSNNKKFTGSLSKHLVRWKWGLSLFGVMVFFIALPFSARLDFDRRIESLFPPEDADVRAYQELQEVFGGKSIVLMVYQDRELTSRAGLARNRLITDAIDRLSGVSDVLSISKLNDAMDRFRPSLGKSETPKLFREDDPVANGFAILFSNYTHSADLKSAAIVVLLHDQDKAQTVNELRALRDDLLSGDFFTTAERQSERSSGFDAIPDSDHCLEAVLVGESVMIDDALNLIQRDGAWLASLTVTLLSLVLLLTLGEWRLIILAGVSIAWTVVVTQAILVLLGWQLSIASSVLTALVTVMIVTAVLHLGVRYQRLLSRGVNRQDATIVAVSGLCLPVFWTGVTDAAGFLALSISTLAPIQQFGLMVTIAVFAGLFAVCLFVGVCLPLKLATYSSRRGTGVRGFFPVIAFFSAIRNQLRSSLRRLAFVIVIKSMRRPKLILTTLLILMCFAVIGVPQLESERSFLNNFESHSQIVRSYQAVEYHFGGAGVWDVILDAPVDVSDAYLTQVRELEEELRSIDASGARLTKVLSIADAESVVRRSRFAAFLPVGPRLSFMAVALPGFFDALLSEPVDGKRKLRLMLRSREDLEPFQKEQLIKEVRRVINAYSDTEIVTNAESFENQGKVTGYYILLSRLIDQVLRDQWQCFLSAIAMVGVLVWVFVGSVRLAVVSLIPNVMPMIIVLAVCGMMGARLNMGAAMIAAVSIGISIDGSVHLLFQYCRQRRVRGHCIDRSLQVAAGQTGFPVMLATLALVVGFGVLSMSEFVPTATFGFLISVTLALGTVGNLSFLPVLVKLVEHE